MMPYIATPAWARVSEKAIFIAVYGLLTVNGVFFAMLAPFGWLGWIAAISALSCVFGAITGRYRWEWVALSPLVTSLLIGIITVSSALDIYDILFVVIVSLNLLRRGIHLTLVAKAIRGADDE